MNDGGRLMLTLGTSEVIGGVADVRNYGKIPHDNANPFDIKRTTTAPRDHAQDQQRVCRGHSGSVAYGGKIFRSQCEGSPRGRDGAIAQLCKGS
jgi:hypothetical protein